MSDDKKIVQFPMDRLKNKQGVKPDTAEAAPTVRRSTLVMSLLSTVLIATFVATQVNKQSESLQKTADRVIASIESKTDLQEDILLARKISRDSLRQPASGGREPTPEDILRHGSELASLYALRFDDKGALVELKYQGPEGQKRNIRDREDFIRRNADLFKISFGQVVRDASTELGSKTQNANERFEVYKLLDGDKAKAKVHFTLEGENKVTQINVESL